jgi:hypothetical protein
LKEEAWAKQRPAEPIAPVPRYEALSEEKRAVLAYDRKPLADLWPHAVTPSLVGASWGRLRRTFHLSSIRACWALAAAAA